MNFRQQELITKKEKSLQQKAILPEISSRLSRRQQRVSQKPERAGEIRSSAEKKALTTHLKTSVFLILRSLELMTTVRHKFFLVLRTLISLADFLQDGYQGRSQGDNGHKWADGIVVIFRSIF